MSGAWCACDYDDGEPVEISRSSDPRARKLYTCDDCGGPITPGEVYHRHDYLTREYGWGTYLNCTGCDEIVAFFKATCGCVSWGMFAETLGDCIREETDPRIRRKAEKLLARLKERQQRGLIASGRAQRSLQGGWWSPRDLAAVIAGARAARAEAPA